VGLHRELFDDGQGGGPGPPPAAFDEMAQRFPRIVVIAMAATRAPEQEA
jgi:hypothetical protein